MQILISATQFLTQIPKIRGFLIQQGRLQKEDIGLIIVQDNSSFVAVNRVKVQKALNYLKDQKLKTKKVKIAISE